jgi:hypothetical protein
MMLRILSFFPCVLRLIEELQRAQTDTLLLQDRLELALNDRARLWERQEDPLTRFSKPAAISISITSASFN